MCSGCLTSYPYTHLSVCVFVYSADGEKLAVVGSPFWMAPEVLRDEPYNEKVSLSAGHDSVSEAEVGYLHRLITQQVAQ